MFYLLFIKKKYLILLNLKKRYECPLGEASTDILFVLRMNVTGVMGVSQIDDHRHPRVFEIKSLSNVPPAVKEKGWWES